MYYVGMSRKLGDIIREAREHKDLTTRQLGERIGLTHSAISRIENGDTKRPEVATIRKISEVLEIPESRLLEAMGYYGGAFDPTERRESVMPARVREAIERIDAYATPEERMEALMRLEPDVYDQIDRLFADWVQARLLRRRGNTGPLPGSAPQDSQKREPNGRGHQEM